MSDVEKKNNGEHEQTEGRNNEGLEKEINMKEKQNEIHEEAEINLEYEVGIRENENEMRENAETSLEKEVKICLEKEVKMNLERELKMNVQKEIENNSEKEIKVTLKKKLNLNFEKEVKVNVEKLENTNSEKDIKTKVGRESKTSTERENKSNSDFEGVIKRTGSKGILRLDIGKPRRTSSSDYRTSPQGEPSSPQPSVDRVSVTFAEDSKSDSSSRHQNFPQTMDKIHFPPVTDEENSEEEDYSASVTAIIQKRQSTRRSKRRSSRRASSPFSPDILPGSENGRRRSSVFTTSSGDTAITIDESLAPELTQEQIFENIRIHKEVLSSVKMQPWNMRKKLRLVAQAKSYIKRHQGALQERLAQSHSTKDMLARCNLYFVQKMQHYKRELANLSNWFIPWERRIKEIESHFGSVVASYFIFLRWLFWVNLVIASISVAFVTVPELLTAKSAEAGDRKFILPEEKYNATNFLILWDFEGVLKYSPLFYGWYTNKEDSSGHGYRLPLAFFMTGLVVYAYSFVATLRKMAENSRMSKLSEKDDECIFSWKLFTGWDYMIGNAETAHNRVASIVMGFKEALLEEAEKKREDRNWRILGSRVMVNTLVLFFFTLSAFAVVEVVRRSTEPEAKSTIWRQNETTVIITLISNIFPMLFEALGYLEHYHPRKQLRMQLARIMVLNLLNLYSLIFAQFDKINDMSEELENLRPNRSNLTCDTNFILPLFELPLTTPLPLIEPKCYTLCNETVTNLTSANLLTLVSTAAIASFPKLLQLFATKINENSTDLRNFTEMESFDSNEVGNFDNITYLEELINLNGSEFYNSKNQYYYGNDTNNSITVNPTKEEYTTPPFKTFEDHLLDLKDAFVDYLTYVISPIYLALQGNGTIGNYTEWNITEDGFSYFMSTVAPFLNETPDDNAYNTLYENVTSTISTVLENSGQKCQVFCDNDTKTNEIDAKLPCDYSTRSRLRSLCWETMFGQELVKITVMDLVMTILSTLFMDFFRGIFVRVMNNCWCWDLEKKFPNYGDFKVAENILQLVNNQGMVWMGMFFSPGLVVLNVFKLVIIMYLKSWAVLTCNVPHEVIFRASRSNNFYFALLLMMLFLCVLPVGYAIVWKKPSWHCGPFSKYPLIFHIFTTTIKKSLPSSLHGILDYIASPGIVIPLLVLLILIIYYLVSLTNSLREANTDLKIQLRRERTEERRKMFKIADRRRRNGSEGSGEFENTPFGKWRKLLQTLPSAAKSLDDTPKQESEELPPPPLLKEARVENIKRDFLSKFIKALRKTSITSEEESPPAQDDGTDNEQHDSLPEDLICVKESKPQASRKVFDRITTGGSFKKTINAALAQARNKPIVEILPKRSSGPNETKHVKINKSVPVTIHSTTPRRKDTFDLKKTQELRQKRAMQSPSRSGSSREVREDSLSSIWSDNIPVITISKTESAENILDEKPKEQSGKSEESNEKSKISSIGLHGKWAKVKKAKEENTEENIGKQEGVVKHKTHKEKLRHENKVITEKYREERRISTSRVRNMERTLDTISSSNDNLDSDSQDTPTKKYIVKKENADINDDNEYEDRKKEKIRDNDGRENKWKRDKKSDGKKENKNEENGDVSTDFREEAKKNLRSEDKNELKRGDKKEVKSEDKKDSKNKDKLKNKEKKELRSEDKAEVKIKGRRELKSEGEKNQDEDELKDENQEELRNEDQNDQICQKDQIELDKYGYNTKSSHKSDLYDEQKESIQKVKELGRKENEEKNIEGNFWKIDENHSIKKESTSTKKVAERKEVKKPVLKKQSSAIVIDDEEPTVMEAEPQVQREESKLSSTNGESIQTTDTLRTESSTDYKDEVFSNYNIL